ncbi:hypothetical protein [Rhizobium sp. ZPR3]|uniref:Uncharacterized protein n=2 Tax=unclassified Rhizobium TaxID=2613769 RepID=A0AAU7SF30_9HYPH
MDCDKVKVYVCPVVGREKEIAKIKEIIVSLGSDIVCSEKQDLVGFRQCVDQADVVAILICAETDNEAYREVIEYAAKTGKRVVGIWLEDGAAPRLPAILDRLGDGAILPTKENIEKAVICGDSIWQLPAGDERPTQRTPRHKG